MFWYNLDCGAGCGVFFLPCFRPQQTWSQMGWSQCLLPWKSGLLYDSEHTPIPSSSQLHPISASRFVCLQSETMRGEVDWNSQVFPDALPQRIVWHCLCWPSGHQSNQLLCYVEGCIQWPQLAPAVQVSVLRFQNMINNHTYSGNSNTSRSHKVRNPKDKMTWNEILKTSRKCVWVDTYIRTVEKRFGSDIRSRFVSLLLQNEFIRVSFGSFVGPKVRTLLRRTKKTNG